MSWRALPLSLVIAFALTGIIASVTLFNAYSVDQGIAKLSTDLSGQPAAKVAGSLENFQSRIWLWAAFFLLHGVAVAWLAARAISDPLLRLTRAADAIRKGDSGAKLPAEEGYRELNELSRSLQSLVQDLKAKEKLQSELAESLEAQVLQRTEELSEQNRRLEIANERAELAVASKSRFLAAASHDLRQPLQALTLITRRLGRRITTGENAEIVARVESSVAALNSMFNSLLDMTRLDSGIIEVRKTHVALEPLLASIGEDYAPELASRCIKFRLRCPPLFAETDPVVLETMVRNLLSNAAKFTARGSILFAARPHGRDIAISVYDTGTGIEPGKHETIFQEFERAQKQADGANQGLGLGLSIVKRYAALLGTDVRVRSCPGRGSCFTLIVPRSHMTTTDDVAMPSSSIPAYWNSRRVLLLDDDTSVLRALRDELTDRGAVVSAFETVREAEAAIDNGLEIELAIADYDLSETSTGMAFLERLRVKKNRNLAALILTGRTDPVTIGAIKASGLSWLAKPAGSEQIAEYFARPD